MKQEVDALAEFLNFGKERGLQPIIVYSDKDAAQHGAVERIWPEARLLLCHVLMERAVDRALHALGVRKGSPFRLTIVDLDDREMIKSMMKRHGRMNLHIPTQNGFSESLLLTLSIVSWSRQPQISLPKFWIISGRTGTTETSWSIGVMSPLSSTYRLPARPTRLNLYGLLSNGMYQ